MVNNLFNVFGARHGYWDIKRSFRLLCGRLRPSLYPRFLSLIKLDGALALKNSLEVVSVFRL